MVESFEKGYYNQTVKAANAATACSHKRQLVEKTNQIEAALAATEINRLIREI